MFDLLKFVCIFFLADIGFALAFYTLIKGTTHTVVANQHREDVLELEGVYLPFSSIGYGMISVIR